MNESLVAGVNGPCVFLLFPPSPPLFVFEVGALLTVFCKFEFLPKWTFNVASKLVLLTSGEIHVPCSKSSRPKVAFVQPATRATHSN